MFVLTQTGLVSNDPSHFSRTDSEKIDHDTHRAVEEAWFRTAERGVGEEALRSGDVFTAFTDWVEYRGMVPRPDIMGHKPDGTVLGSFYSGGYSPLDLEPDRRGPLGIFLVHEVDGNPGIYLAKYTCPNPPRGIVTPFLLYSGTNPLGQEDGLVQLPNGNFLLSEFNGDLSTNDDNIMEVDGMTWDLLRQDVDRLNCFCLATEMRTRMIHP